MAKTSIHLTECDITGCELHNKRERPLSYIRPELFHLNESFNFTCNSLTTELQRIKRDVKEKTGRKLQKNAIAIKEGVAVIDEKTSMDDLKKFCERCNEEFGMIPLQIHIHRDEGHRNSKEWKPNLHAHIIFRMYNKEGRNVRFGQKDCAWMQTILAESLNMERGNPSKKKHVEALQFKIDAKQKELAETTKEAEAALEKKDAIKAETDQLNVAKVRKEAAIEVVHEAVEGVKSFFGASDRDKQIKSLTEQIKTLQDEKEQLKEGFEEEKKKAAADSQNVLNTELGKVRQHTANLQSSLETVRRERNEARKTADVFRSLLTSVWEGLIEAIKAMLELAYDDRRRNFNQTEVTAIDNALGADNDVDTRRALGLELIRRAKEECPDSIHKGRIDTQHQDIEAIANRIYQGKKQDRSIKL